VGLLGNNASLDIGQVIISLTRRMNMNIGNVEIDQELVYRSRWGKKECGPRICVTEIQRAGTEEPQIGYRDSLRQVRYVTRDRIIGVVIDPMEASWPVGSQFLGLAVDFDIPESVPA